ncbi:lipoyl domain-containing protein [Falsiroseomonas selenitidurans]|uniref:2-oxoglutarate dehydrogenase n=1 Tax=Falsiroseomonas selenitidurans TaxID=2716335 RepID=A0ABX1ECR3_9PROT|nr:lipoyl domain-containing protein [Falsiroseomonas selenitidurans]NKC34605.1 2-oxoglutarate dehydrogenase [Falsiroseomonas selenitidurans]
MIRQLRVPGPIADVEEVRVLQWHAAEGDRVEPDALVVELETHKAVVEVRAGRAAWLRRRLCAEGEWQMLGAPLALLSDDAAETLPEDAATAAEWPVAFEVT